MTDDTASPPAHTAPQTDSAADPQFDREMKAHEERMAMKREADQIEHEQNRRTEIDQELQSLEGQRNGDKADALKEERQQLDATAKERWERNTKDAQSGTPSQNAPGSPAEAAPSQAPLLSPEEMRTTIAEVNEKLSRPQEIFNALKQERSDEYRKVRGNSLPEPTTAMDGVRAAPGSPMLSGNEPPRQGPGGPMTDIRGSSQLPHRAQSDDPKSAAGNVKIPTSSEGSLMKSIAAISKKNRSLQLRVLPAVMAQTQARLIRTNSIRQQKKLTRKERLKNLAKTAKPASLLFVIVLIAAAVVFDAFDLLKEPIALIPYVGWLINVFIAILKLLFIGVPTFFMARKVKKISKGTASIIAYGDGLLRDAEIGLRRVAPFALEMKQPKRLKQADPNEEGGSLKQIVLYESRILLNQILVQILEAIPLADLGPWQFVRVFRVYRDQQKEYRKARAAIAGCQLISDKLDAQMKIEVDYLTLCLRLIQQLLIRASRRGVSGLVANAAGSLRNRAFRPPANSPAVQGGTAPTLRPQFVS